MSNTQTINQLALVNLLIANRGLYSLLKQIFKAKPVNGHSYKKEGVVVTTLKFKGELKNRLYVSNLPASIQIEKKHIANKRNLFIITVEISGRKTDQVEAAYEEARAVYAVRHQEEDLANKNTIAV